LWAKGPAEAAAGCERGVGAGAMSAPPQPSELPGAPLLAWRGARLELEGHALDAIAHEHGTPLYVYSREAMRRALAAYSDELAFIA
jgi:hypothetical protein